MKTLVRCLLVLSVLAFARTGAANEPAKIPLKVLYLARSGDADRTQSFSELLSDRFELCRVEARTAFEPEKVRDVDVVIVDWPQSERSVHGGQSPLGPIERWQTPTLLLGSAGLLVADAWNVIGDAG